MDTVGSWYNSFLCMTVVRRDTLCMALAKVVPKKIDIKIFMLDACALYFTKYREKGLPDLVYAEIFTLYRESYLNRTPSLSILARSVLG